DGYRYLQDYDLGKPNPKPVHKSMELGPRDRLSQAFIKEREKGRTIKGPYGDYVHLDIRHLGEDVIDTKLPFVRELCSKYENLDPVKELIPVRPVVHYMMGGVHTDIHGATPLKCLYAAGEVACVSINGANRLGSNSLTELLVFGARAGKAAANFASDQPEIGVHVAALAKDEAKRLQEEFFRSDGGNESIATLRKEMHEAMEGGAGIYRDKASLEKSQEVISDLQARFLNLTISDHSLTFNTELVSAIELSYMLDVAEAIVQSALQRKESRGSHQRTDYPMRDDKNFLAHSLAYRSEDDPPKIEHLPVTITRWPAGERVYGK
ncbi:FAD-binding protein, partial [bacterium]|nr:FAD-binding protein [bacterium]